MAKNGNGKKVVEKTGGKDKTIAELVSILDADMAEEVETKSWISTGVRSLNFLLSGDVDKGIPAGKMVIVAGEQQSGKSLLGARIASHAQQQDYVIVWFDSEHAADKKFLGRQGLDIEKVIYKSVDTVEEFQNHAVKALNWAKEKERKLFIVLDSLGALSGAKETTDANAEKMTMDMGLRAKNIRTSFKQIIHRLGASDSCFFCINHVYIKPSLFPTKEMGGGMAAWYLGQIVLFLTKLKGEDGVFSRVRMKSKKNREFIEGRMTEFEINFRTGIDPNDGLLELFEEFDVIKKKGGWYNLNGDDKSYRPDDIFKNEETMSKLVSILREKTKNFTYSTFDIK